MFYDFKNYLKIKMMLSQNVQLKSSNNKFLSVSQNGKSLLCDKSEKDSDIFIMKYEGRYVTFQTKGGKYLSATVNGTLEADKDKIGGTERFEIEWLDDEWFVLKSNNGNYISVQKDGKIDINQKNIEENEKFKLIVKRVESLIEFLCF